jgi:hypothetical protein
MNGGELLTTDSRYGRTRRYERRCGRMTNEEAILILQDDLNHVKSHLQYIGKAPEYYEEMSNLAEALDIGIRAIDNAPTECEKYRSFCMAKQRPKGKYEFIEILAHYVPRDTCIYPEYKGKPYYSIHFRENGEDYDGFGTYNPEVLSRYLRDYFFEQKGEEGEQKAEEEQIQQDLSGEP